MPVIFKGRNVWELTMYEGRYNQVGDVFIVEDGLEDFKIGTWAVGTARFQYQFNVWHHGCGQWVEYPAVKFCSLRDALDYVSRWTDAVALAGHFVDRV